jgi:hypothetical protein
MRGKASAEFGHEPIIRKPPLRDQPTPMLAADADGRRAVHLVHDRETPMRIFAVKIHEPNVERREITSVEEPDDFMRDDNLSISGG